MNTDTTTVEIPADVRDNSETVTDYAFQRQRAQSDYPYHTVDERYREIERVTVFPGMGLTHYQWRDVNPDGQRCRFDMIVNEGGTVVNLFHTEYFTRAPCCTHDGHYATYYAAVADPTDPTEYDPVPFCDECVPQLRRSVAGIRPAVTLSLSERLLTGQHD